MHRRESVNLDCFAQTKRSSNKKLIAPGAGAAIHFSKLGAKVAITGRNVENLKETESKCVGEILLIAADINNEADRVKIVEQTVAKFGGLDVLVNNAGLGESGDVQTTTMDQYDLVMNTNVRSVFHLTQLATPHLIKTQGNIVNVSSVAGPRQFPNLVAYCMSKAAIDQFTKCTALDLAPHNVRVNAVNPAFIVTNFHKRLGMDDEAYEKFKDHAKNTHALGRPGTIDETSNAIAFLANNDLASFTTGTCLLVDGGKACMCPR